MILKLRTHQKTQPNLIKYAKKNSRELLADINHEKDMTLKLS